MKRTLLIDNNNTKKHKMRLDIIVCVDKNNGIGKSGTIPWRLSEDLKHFKNITITTTSDKYTNAVIMGRKTWQSIPPKFRPLPDRINIVVSTTLTETPPESTYFVNSYDSALDLTDTFANLESTFIIGGSSLYNTAIKDKRLRYVYLTQYDEEHDCDVHFPTELVVENLKCTSEHTSETNSKLTFKTYTVPNLEEERMLDVMREILTSGIKNPDRTGVGTLSVFGKQMTYDLTASFPLMTTRKAYMRQILEEFKFIMSGSTDVTNLQKKNVHIWDDNTTRDFLDKRGLTHLPEFDMGPTYGFSMRHYGATYETCKTDYTGKGFDQLQYVIDTIKSDPTSRRIRISIWDPSHIFDVALTPCLNQFDFYVDTERNTLNLLAFLRSSDTFLALMWNTTYCAIFCHVIAKLTGLRAGKLIMNTANSHLYLTHQEQAKEQVSRTPYPFPSCSIMKHLTTIDDIQGLEVADFRIRGYTAHPAIKADMAV